MILEIPLVAILSIIAGVAILIVPKLLNYIVAFYLIISGIVMVVNSS